MGRSVIAAMGLFAGVAILAAALSVVAISEFGPERVPPTGVGRRGVARPGERDAAARVRADLAAGTSGRAEAPSQQAAERLSLSVMKPFGPPLPSLEIDAILDADQDAAWKVREVARIPAERRGAAIAALAAALGRDPSVAESLATMLRTATGDDLDALTKALRDGAAFQARDEIRAVALEVLRRDPLEERRVAAAWALRFAGRDPLPEDEQREILAAFREERSWRVVAALGEAATGGIAREMLSAALDDVLARIEPGPHRVRIADARRNPAGGRTRFSVLLQRFDEAVSQDERDSVAALLVSLNSGGFTSRTSGVRATYIEPYADRAARQTSRQAAFLRVYGGTSVAATRSRLVCEIAGSPWDCFDAVRADPQGLAQAYSAFVREVAAIEPVESLAERLRVIAERVEAGGEQASAADFPKSRKGG